MVSIINYLFEEKDSTKLSDREKKIGGLAAVGGLALASTGKSLSSSADTDQLKNMLTWHIDKYHNSIKPSQYHSSPEFSDAVKYNEWQKKIGGNLNKIGLGIAGTTAVGLGAHKLYKMYKNRKKEKQS